MRNEIKIDDKKIKKASQLSGINNLSKLIDESLNEYIRACRMRKLLKLEGKIKFDEDYQPVYEG